MQTIDELGISPIPWTVGKIGVPRCIISSDDEIVATEQVTKHGDANSCLIAAAPELYKCLREAVIEVCHNFTCCGSSEDGYKCNGDRECFVRKWRAAIAKASGEDSDCGHYEGCNGWTKKEITKNG